MQLHPLKRVTIVCEAYARNAITDLVREIGAHGYTLFRVEGEGARGERTADIEEFANIQLEVILPPARAECLMERLHAEYFSRFAIIAYETDVRVIRSQKF